ncbi:MAG TPA: hypothetical protein VKG43_06185 [Acidimicrobiales bacterium]|nr:hypothetical protein [Acidimicrobiales bacterium]
MPADVPMHVYVKFLDSAREYLGGRYGGAWIDQDAEGARSISIAVVGPTDADRSKIGNLAGKHSDAVELVPVKYAREELLAWHKAIANAVMGAEGSRGARTLLATGKGFYVFAGVGWDPRQNKVVVWTSGPFIPEDAIGSSPVVGEIPDSIPSDAWIIDTNRVVSIAPLSASVGEH